MFALSISPIFLKSVQNDPIKTTFAIILTTGVIGIFLAQVRPFEYVLINIIAWRSKKLREIKKKPKDTVCGVFFSPHIAEERNLLIGSIYFTISILLLAVLDPLSLSTFFCIVLVILTVIMFCFSLYNSQNLPGKMVLLEKVYTMSNSALAEYDAVRSALAIKDWREVERIVREWDLKATPSVVE